MTLRRIGLVFLALLLVAWPFPTLAQDATPTTSGNVSVDLAAMALTADDVPAGFFDDYGEWWSPPDTFSAGVLGGEPTPQGLEGVYETFYVNPDDGITIHVFLFQFASAENATAGMSLVAPALRPPLPDGIVEGPTLAAGPAIGDTPSELTFITYDTWEAGGPRVDVVANAFHHDRILAGVAVEAYSDPPAPGTPAPAIATPLAVVASQAELATILATALDERIASAFTGQAPAYVDPALGAAVLPLDQLVDAQTPIIGGYKSGIDLLRCGICGEENSLMPFAGDARGGFSRLVALGPLVDGEPQPPFVLVAVADFSSPEAAQGVLDAIRQAPNDLPTAGPIPRGERTLASDPTIPGADTVVAYQAISNPDDPDAPIDSAGVDFVVGSQLATVDVLGGLSAGDAMAAAVDLAAQQAACLISGEPCASVTLPASIPATSG